MEIVETGVEDAYRITPRILGDSRGGFFESYKYGELLRATGHVFVPRQVNYSVSRANTVRGIHGVALPPGQAKLVSCVRGTLLDIVVDVRIGSPTFGRHAVNLLHADEGTAVFVAEGLGHGFLALTEDATISYLCSTEFVPGTQLDIQPFDRQLDLPWSSHLDGEALLSEKDARAPTLAEAADRGLLATYRECRALYAEQRRSEGLSR